MTDPFVKLTYINNVVVWFNMDHVLTMRQESPGLTILELDSMVTSGYTRVAVIESPDQIQTLRSGLMPLS